jgi:hypothetical protein
MKHAFLGVLLSWIATDFLGAADYPDWAKPYLKAQVAEWSMKPAVQLLESQSAKFTTPDRVVQTTRAIIQVNSATGRERAAIGTTYNPNMERMAKLRGWIVSADRKKTKTISRNRFLDMPANIGGIEWSSQRSVILDVGDEIEIGGLLIYEIEMESNSPITEVGHIFESSLPVERSELEVIPPEGKTLLWYATGDRQEMTPLPGASAGALRWVKTRIDVLEDSEFEGFYRKSDGVLVRCERPAGVEMDLSSWTNFSAAVVPVFQSQLRTDGAVAAKAKELVASANTDWERIGALCRFVQKDIRYLQIDLNKDYLAGYRPNPAAEVLANRYGDCKDKATLLISLLRAIGKEGYYLLVSSGDPFAVPEDWPSLRFNHVIVAIPADDTTPVSWPIIEDHRLGKLVTFDPTNPVAPLGVLASEDQGGWGLIVSSPGSTLVRMPFEEPTRTGVERTITASLSPNGGLMASFKERTLGSRGADSYWERFKQANDRYGRSLEEGIHAVFPVTSKFAWKDHWDEAGALHEVEMTFEVINFSRRLGMERMLVTPGIFAPDRTLPPSPAEFETIMFYPGYLKENVRLKIPDGWVVQELPDNWSLMNERSSCVLKYRLEGSEIVYESEFINKGGMFDRAAYDSLRALRAKVHDATRRAAVLKFEPGLAAATVLPKDAASAVGSGTSVSRIQTPPNADLGKIQLKEGATKADVEGFVRAIAKLVSAQSDLSGYTANQQGSKEPAITQEQLVEKLATTPTEHLDVLLKETVSVSGRIVLYPILRVINTRADIGEDMKEPVLRAFEHHPVLIKTILRKQWLPGVEAKFIALTKKDPERAVVDYVEVLAAIDRPDAREALTEFLTKGTGATLVKSYAAAKTVNAACVDWDEVVPKAWRALGLLSLKRAVPDMIDFAPIAAEYGVTDALVMVAKKLNSPAVRSDEKDAALRERCVRVLRQVVVLPDPGERALVKYVLDNRSALVFDKANRKYAVAK